MPLTREQREEFLAGTHPACLAVDARDGRGPLNVPIWYAYRPGGRFSAVTAGDSRKARLLAAAGRATFLVQRVEPTYRYVSAEGPVTLRTATAEDLTAVASRYLAPDVVAAYVENSLRRFGPDGMALVELLPEHWLSADIGAS
ncbi:pyridoxamine 5'-phosphate oxidase family protein [Streptomyces sp. SID5785]|uniref:pyridoxamine 5'-phosphate oxidase family protein n=1 Tax=Streptomyces sp. SID5785 TaxID=2690309 RepID=UPI001361BE5C|nr:pyridoxamine 5'-phosphate oxidase family protein [Streptomyces sp. SID5785]MZD03931.1 pyridoxamine 5'-phosphate oxidase family protein [Streptomyces sp. SID5785]